MNHINEEQQIQTQFFMHTKVYFPDKPGQQYVTANIPYNGVEQEEYDINELHEYIDDYLDLLYGDEDYVFGTYSSFIVETITDRYFNVLQINGQTGEQKKFSTPLQDKYANGINNLFKENDKKLFEEINQFKEKFTSLKKFEEIDLENEEDKFQINELKSSSKKLKKVLLENHEKDFNEIYGDKKKNYFCLLRYIYYRLKEIKEKNGEGKNFTMVQLLQEFIDVGYKGKINSLFDENICNYETFTLQNLKDWYYYNEKNKGGKHNSASKITIHILDAFFQRIEYLHKKNDSGFTALVFILNNQHCYPILNEKFIKQVTSLNSNEKYPSLKINSLLEFDKISYREKKNDANSIYYIDMNISLGEVDEDLQNDILTSLSKLNLNDPNFNDSNISPIYDCVVDVYKKKIVYDPLEPEKSKTEIFDLYFKNIDNLSDIYKYLINGIEHNKDGFEIETYIVQGNLLFIIFAIASKLNVSVPTHNIKIRNGEIISFVHPISNKLIKKVTEYEIKKKACNILRNNLIQNQKQLFNIDDNIFTPQLLHNFIYTDQTWSLLATEFISHSFFDFPTSKYETFSLNIIDKYSTRPIIGSNFNDFNDFNEFFKNPQKIIAYDITHSYPTAVRTMNTNYPVFGIQNTFLKFDKETMINDDGNLKNGFYLVENFNIKKFNINFESEIMTPNLVDYLLDNEYINYDKIIAGMIADDYIDYNKLNNIVENIFKIFPSMDRKSDDYIIRKNILNCMIGDFGKKYDSYDRGCITTDVDYIFYLYDIFKEVNKNNKVSNFDFVGVNGSYFIRTSQKKRLSEDNSPINTQILCEAKKNLLVMLSHVWIENESKLLSFNTDSIYLLDAKILSKEKIQESALKLPPIKEENNNNILNNNKTTIKFTLPLKSNNDINNFKGKKIKQNFKSNHPFFKMTPTKTQIKKNITNEFIIKEGNYQIEIRNENHENIKYYKPCKNRDQYNYDMLPIKDYNLLDDIMFSGDKIKRNNIIENDFSYLQELRKKSFFCTGGGGSQKSTLLASFHSNQYSFKNEKHEIILNPSEEILVLCPTNKAAQLLKNGKGCLNVFTFNKFFNVGVDDKENINNNNNNEKMINLPQNKISEKYKILQIDEFSMVSSHFYFLIIQNYQNRLKSSSPLIIQIYGDKNQCEPIKQRYYIYENQRFFRELVNYNKIQKKYYDSGSNRFEKNVYLLSQFILQNKRFPKPKEFNNYDLFKNNTIKFKDDPKPFTIGFHNIRYINKQNESSQIYKKNLYWYKKFNPEGYKNNNKVLNPTYCDGMKVVCIQNLKHKKPPIFNSESFTVSRVDGNDLYLVNEFEFKDKDNNIYKELGPYHKSNFVLGYASTVFVTQGDTIKTEYAITDMNKMTINQIYTAITRAEKLSQIFFTTNSEEKFYKYKFEEKMIDGIKCLTSEAPSFGLIYHIYSPQFKIQYIGQHVVKKIGLKNIKENKENIFIGEYDKDYRFIEHMSIKNDWVTNDNKNTFKNDIITYVIGSNGYKFKNIINILEKRNISIKADDFDFKFANKALDSQKKNFDKMNSLIGTFTENIKNPGFNELKLNVLKKMDELEFLNSFNNPIKKTKREGSLDNAKKFYFYFRVPDYFILHLKDKKNTFIKSFQITENTIKDKKTKKDITNFKKQESITNEYTRKEKWEDTDIIFNSKEEAIQAMKDELKEKYKSLLEEYFLR